MRWLIFILLLPVPALADTWKGIPGIVDGDSITLDGQELRLLSIDAPELEQECVRDGQPYRCGIDASFALIGIIQDREVTCEGSVRHWWSCRIFTQMRH